MNDEEQKKFKGLLLETYCNFSQFCHDHQINFYACAGTAIGVVRHQGFIPWDDDIDVCMKREDYDKFVSLKHELKDSDYEILDINDKGYYSTFAKFCSKRSSIWEYKSEPIMFGAYVDIFPLDPAHGKLESVIEQRFEYKKLADKYLLCTMSRSFKEITCALKKGEISTAIWYFCEKIIFPHFQDIVKSKLKRIRLRKFTEGEDYYIIYAGGYGSRDVWLPRWFDGIVMMPFENIEMPLPVGYHDMLSQVYGDYMQLPPLEKRISRHSHYYFNLEKRLSIKEAIQIINEEQ